MEPDPVVPEDKIRSAGTSRLTSLRKAAPLIVLIAGVSAYAVYFATLSILRFESFNSSINDLGFYNELMWISVHGGPPAWAQNVQTNFYAAYPWQTASFLLFVPLYAAFPSPITLLVVQAIGLPLAALPIFALSRRYGISEWGSLALAGCYLLNFQVQSVNLNDFHLQSFFPLAFFSMILFFEYGWRKWFLVAGAISLITNPLTLILTLGFVLGVYIQRPSSEGLVGRVWKRFLDAARHLRPEFVLVALGVLLLVVEGSLGLIGAYHLGSQSSPGSGGLVNFFLQRGIYFGAAFAPFVGVAVYQRETQILCIPLLLFLALGAINFAGFIGRQDTLEYMVVALWGLMLFARLHPGRRVQAAAERVARQRRWTLDGAPPRRQMNLTIASAVVASAAAFAVFSPVSPWNQVPGLIAGVNEVPSQISDVTPADHFLQSAIGLIAPSSSVLTQNNIPQLTGRDSFQWAFPGLPTPNLTGVQYILSDQSTNSFARHWFVFLQPYVEQALASREFGVLADGYGVLLLERGYSGSPQLEGPIPFAATDMSLATGYYAHGVAVHPAAANNIFWYGPYIDLVAGNYTVTFTLEAGSGGTFSEPIIRLAVTNGTTSYPTVYAALQLYRFNFPSANTWESISINFTLPTFVASIELPGQEPTAVTSISMAGATITIDSLSQ